MTYKQLITYLLEMPDLEAEAVVTKWTRDVANGGVVVAKHQAPVSHVSVLTTGGIVFEEDKLSKIPNDLYQ